MASPGPASTRRSSAAAPRRAAAVIALAVAAVGVLWILVSSRGEDQTLRASFASAINLVEGHPIRIAGEKVGEVKSILHVDGRAVVELSVDEARALPLRRGTRARIRYGATTTYADRYVEVVPGPGSAPPLADGSVLPPGDVLSPVEFDDMAQILDRKTRPELQGLVRKFGDTLENHTRTLGPGIDSTAEGLDETASFLRELGADRAALRTLVDAGARASGAIARNEDDLRQLISNAAQTFDEFAEHADATRASFDRFPGMLRLTRRGLNRFDNTVGVLDALTNDIRPGARRLRTLAPVLRRVIVNLENVSPLAASALRRARLASPDIRRFLRAGTPFMGRFGDASQGLGKIFSCIRPYAPELVAFLGTWAGFEKHYDAQGHYARSHFNTALPMGNGTQMSSADIVASNPGVSYAFPRPPGLNEGQPWFIPECGVGPESLDATQDPETKR